MELIIKEVPDDEAVKVEILANAETTIRNYYSRQIRVVAKEKEDEYNATIASFKEVNKLGAAKLTEDNP